MNWVFRVLGYRIFEIPIFFYSLGFRVWCNFLIHVIGDLSLQSLSNLVQRIKMKMELRTTKFQIFCIVFAKKKVKCLPVKNAGQIKGKM